MSGLSFHPVTLADGFPEESHHHLPPPPPLAHTRPSSPDPEKGLVTPPPTSTSYYSTPSEKPPPTPSAPIALPTTTPPLTRHKSMHVWRVLIYLTTIAPFLSAFNAAYTLFHLILSALTLPFTTTPRLTLAHRLTLPLRWHLHFLLLHPPTSTSTPRADASPGRLALMHLLSPIVAVPTAMFAAGVALLWLYTEVLLGDWNEPGGFEYCAYVWVESRWARFVGGRRR